jgi:hypothetical protein
MWDYASAIKSQAQIILQHPFDWQKNLTALNKIYTIAETIAGSD